MDIVNLDRIYSSGVVYPPRPQVFKAIDLCPPDDTKIVIIGQDPYHGEGQANGLAFSVNKGIPVPPSLKNIFQELSNDLGIIPSKHGDLSAWAKQGVLLLNTILTVEKGKPLSHAGLGWEKFTTGVLERLNDSESPICFILWGKKALEKKDLILNPRHGIIASNHPSPFSATKGFFGSKPFSKANKFLIENGIEPVDWRV